MDILFDMDGTLVDPRPGLIGSVQYALQKLGHPVPPAEELLWLIGPPFRVSLPKLLGSAERVEEAIGYYRESYVGGAMFDALVYEGIPEALAALRAEGHRLIVATAKPHRYARPILEHFGLAAQFHAIHGPELDGTNDDKADLVAHIVRNEAVDPGAAVMIGDRAFDMLAALRNGIRPVGAMWGYGTTEELAGAAALCASPRELTAVVLGMDRGAVAAARPRMSAGPEAAVSPDGPGGHS
jgi:phosphoglycolate phosphatase